MNRNIYILLSLMAFLLAGCTDDDNPARDADAQHICITATYREEAMTRASVGYRDYNNMVDPTTMGAFCMKRRTGEVFVDVFTGKASFDNEKTGGYEELDYDNGWKFREVEYRTVDWDFGNYQRYDFFAFMPWNSSGVEISRTSDTQYDMTWNLGAAQCFTFDSKGAPLICHAGVNRMASGGTGDKGLVRFQMDQILTQFQFQFSISPEMGAIRNFEITDVSIPELDVPCEAKVTRTYSLIDNEWVGSDLVYDTTSQQSEPSAPKYIVQNGSVMVSTTATNLDDNNVIHWTNVGPTFYMIHNGSAHVNVKYNVYDKAGYETRHDCTATVNGLFEKTSSNAYNLRILIVPKYLYILSDNDQSGLMMVE